jgi:hypothetical protein
MLAGNDGAGDTRPVLRNADVVPEPLSHMVNVAARLVSATTRVSNIRSVPDGSVPCLRSKLKAARKCEYAAPVTYCVKPLTGCPAISDAVQMSMAVLNDVTTLACAGFDGIAVPNSCVNGPIVTDTTGLVGGVVLAGEVALTLGDVGVPLAALGG